MDAGGAEFDALASWMKGLGLPAWRASQVFSWIHGKLQCGFDTMSDLPSALRTQLAGLAEIHCPGVVRRADSDDGASKYVFRLHDGLTVESVLLPGPGRLTACLSSQVGCPLGCAFCMTGRMGFRRNLVAGEMTGQLNALRRAGTDRITNVVFMGMGEPMLNLDALLAALSVISDGRGAGIGTRHVTVSTVGIPEGIDRLAGHPGQTGLAISLHSAIQATRERLVPAAGRFPLAGIRRAAMRYAAAKNRPVTIEYCLLEGVNDTPEEAGALGDFTRGLPCKINLIPFNEVEGSGFSRPSLRRTGEFLRILEQMGREVTVRRSLASRAGGACGQLGASLAEG